MAIKIFLKTRYSFTVYQNCFDNQIYDKYTCVEATVSAI